MKAAWRYVLGFVLNPITVPKLMARINVQEERVVDIYTKLAVQSETNKLIVEKVKNIVMESELRRYSRGQSSPPSN
jgi:hypothetical protein